MTVTFNNNNDAFITLTQSSTGLTATVVDMIFDWVVLENNTTLTDAEIIDALQAYYEEQANS